MGGEIGQWSEWNYDWQLDWTLLDHDFHRKMQAYVKALNKLYVEQPACTRSTSAGRLSVDRLSRCGQQHRRPFVRRAEGIPTISWWCWLIARPCRGTVIESACPRQDFTGSCSTVTGPVMAAVMSEIPAACTPNQRLGRGNLIPSCLMFHPWPWCSSSGSDAEKISQALLNFGALMTRQEGSGNELLGRLIRANQRPVRIVRPRSGTNVRPGPLFRRATRLSLGPALIVFGSLSNPFADRISVAD